MQTISVAVFAILVAVAAGSPAGCPHPTEAKHLLFEKVAVTPAHSDARHVEHIDIPIDVMGRKDISCITVVSRQQGTTPDMVSFGRNKLHGYSIILHSRIRTPMNATLYIYGQ